MNSVDRVVYISFFKSKRKTHLPQKGHEGEGGHFLNSHFPLPWLDKNNVLTLFSENFAVISSENSPNIFHAPT